MASQFPTRFTPKQASHEGALRIGELDQRQDELLSQLEELEQRTQSLLQEWTKKRSSDEADTMAHEIDDTENPPHAHPERHAA